MTRAQSRTPGVRIDCAGRSSAEIIQKFMTLISKPEPRKDATTVVLSNLPAMQGSMSRFLSEFIASMEPYRASTRVVDESGFVRTMLEMTRQEGRFDVQASENDAPVPGPQNN